MFQESDIEDQGRIALTIVSMILIKAVVETYTNNRLLIRWSKSKEGKEFTIFELL